MRCPECDGQTKVLETREKIKNGEMRRRRVCLDCGHRFTTVEKIVENAQEDKHEG